MFPAAAQLGLGLLQTGIGMVRANKAQKQLENLQTPKYTQSQSITDYYNKALSRYNVDPYSTSLYKMQTQNIARGTSQGIGSLQDKRSGLAGISSLIQGQNDSLLKAGAVAEGQRDQRFGQLGAASSMKADEDRTAFQYNEIMPYEKKFNLLAAKASGGNQVAQSGTQNIFGGLSNMADFAMAKKIFGK